MISRSKMLAVQFCFPNLIYSGFWGIICVGLFSKTCLLKELYEDLCYCITSDLPSAVCTLLLSHMDISYDHTSIFPGARSWCTYWVSVTWRHFHYSLVSDTCHSCLQHLVVLPGETGSGLPALVR